MARFESQDKQFWDVKNNVITKKKCLLIVRFLYRKIIYKIENVGMSSDKIVVG